MHTLESTLFTLIVLEVFKANGVLVSEADSLTKSVSLTSARWRVMGTVVATKKPLNITHIAKLMGQSRQSVLRLVNEMIKDELLILLNNPNHKKSKLIKLSTKGENIYQQLEAKQIPWASDAASNISATDLQITLATLKKINNTFK